MKLFLICIVVLFNILPLIIVTIYTNGQQLNRKITILTAIFSVEIVLTLFSQSLLELYKINSKFSLLPLLIGYQRSIIIYITIALWIVLLVKMIVDYKKLEKKYC